MTKLLCLGDSIMWGVTGFDAAHPRANPTIPDKVGQLIGAQTDNRAVSATSVNDGGQSMVDLLPTVNLADYDYILLGYGANDWGLNRETLDALKAGLEIFSSMYTASGSTAYVLVALMIESFINNATSLDSPNKIGVTQNQVMDTFKDWAQEHGYHCYDWRSDPIVTPQNYKTRLGDGCLHPDFNTQMEMAQRLADYIKSTDTGNHSHPTQPTQPTSPEQPTTPVTPPTQPTEQPSQPTQPTTPPVKLIDDIKLDRLSDLFGIGTNVSKGTDRIISKLNELYKTLETVMGTDHRTVQKTLTSPGNELSRPVRNYALLSFQRLQSDINDLIKVCNANWIVDPMSGDPSPLLELERVDQLTTDHYYQDVVNANWGAIENAINKEIKYINQVLKGE